MKLVKEDKNIIKLPERKSLYRDGLILAEAYVLMNQIEDPEIKEVMTNAYSTCLTSFFRPSDFFGDQ